MEFKSGAELLALCEENGWKISQVMRRREADERELDPEKLDQRMADVWEIMRRSAKEALEEERRSMGGLIGGEARRIFRHLEGGRTACGALTARAAAYAMGVLEVNSSMGLIVAAPTAGSSGVIPGILLALQEEYGYTDGEIVDALYNAGAVGYLAMRNATVAGAVGGCQAEVGVASAMGASAVTELMGGTPQECLDAASAALMNLLGLVCDPVGGLVEYPCQNRNAVGAANALTAAELSLAGIRQLIPFDETLAAMYNVGRRLSPDFKETAMGGCAATPSGRAACKGCETGTRNG